MGIKLSTLNKHDKVYHKLTSDILMSKFFNFRQADRAVIDTMGVFGNQVEFDLSDGTIPLSNTKNIGYKSQLIPEIVGFMRNENNLKWYLEQGMKIWTSNAFDFYRKKLQEDHPWKKLKKDTVEFNKALPEFEALVLSGTDSKAGDLGEFYPKQWRSFKGMQEIEGKDLEIVYVDQLQNLIETMKKTPTSRYGLVTAWNPFDVRAGTAALAPCHCLFQVYMYNDLKGDMRLDLKMYQRSADHLLGVAFNAPQYAILTSVIAKLVGAKPGRFIHTFGDLHLYIGHSGSERANWYKNKKNITWLKKELRKNGPNETLEKLLERLPAEEIPGYDHVPYAIQQLGRESNAEPAKLEVTANNLNSIEVQDIKIIGYDKRPPKLELYGGINPQMAS